MDCVSTDESLRLREECKGTFGNSALSFRGPQLLDFCWRIALGLDTLPTLACYFSSEFLVLGSPLRSGGGLRRGNQAWNVAQDVIV
jgi:hypothetical protein